MKPGRDWEITFGADGAHIRAFEYRRWARRRSRLAFGVMWLLGRPQDGRFFGRIGWVHALANNFVITALAHEYRTHRTVLDLLIADEDAMGADREACETYEMLMKFEPGQQDWADTEKTSTGDSPQNEHNV